MRTEVFRDIRVALAMVAAIVGAGFASGREIVVFFSGMGAFSWLGILAGSAACGFLTGMLVHFAMRTRSASLPQVYARVMDEHCGDAAQMMHGGLMLLTGAVMVSGGAELGALTINLHSARLIGAGVTLLVALAGCKWGTGALAGMGALLVPAIFVYYAAMLAGMPETTPMAVSWGSLPASALLGGLYAALNVAVAGGVACMAGRSAVNPWRVGAITGGCVMVMLMSANAALLSAGEAIRDQPMPGVLLASRWGIAGFYMSAGLMFLAVVSTLCAALSSMREQILSLRPAWGKGALLPPAALCAVISAVGFKPLVDLGYPLMGWGCALMLLALLVFLKDDDSSQKSRGKSKKAAL